MLENGYIKLFRSLINWEWYRDSNTKDLFLHLLLTVNYENKKWRGIEIKRGQRVTSYKKLAEELKPMTLQNVRTAIKHLKSTNEITVETTSEYSIITVVNYDKYQELTHDLTSDQHATNTPLTCDQHQRKKDNKDKNDKKDNNTYISDLDKAINDFKQFRAKVKKPMTERAIKMLLTKLDNLASDDETKIKILEKSIYKGWTDIYKLEGGNSGQDIGRNSVYKNKNEYSEIGFTLPDV